MDKRILLIDGNALLFKAFHATSKQLYDEDSLKQEIDELIKNNQPVSTELISKNFTQRSKETGEAINALRLFGLMIINLIKQFSTEYVLVAFDKGSKTFRHEKDYYKSNRKTPSDIIPQFSSSKRFLELMGITYLEDEHLEADDIIGIYSNFASSQNFKVDVITIDKDLLQLVDQNVTVHLAKKGIKDLETYNLDNFLELAKVSPSQIPDLKALMGDSSDNIKGIKGIGPKTALNLINDYQTIENILINIEKLPSKISSKISQEADLLKEYKLITTIITNSEFIEPSLEKIKILDIEKDLVVDYLHSKSVFSLTNKIKEEW